MIRYPAAAALALTAILSPSHAQDAELDRGLPAVLSDGDVIFDFRLRYENVVEDGIGDSANALTYRLRLGYETAEILDTKLLVEFEHVDDLIDNFNSTTNGLTDFPIVADPQATELNRIQLTNTSLPDTQVILGRQRINLDDERFVGDFNFRQNQQTFDALRVVNDSLGRITIDATYVNQVNRVFGDDSPIGRFEGDTALINVSAETFLGTATGFAYLIEIEEAGGVLSTQTYGGRLTGARTLGPGEVDYALSYARQFDYLNNHVGISAEYISVGGGYSVWRVRGGFSYEKLGEGGGAAFSTPLGSLNSFNGRADVFLTTPDAGLIDIKGEAAVRIGDIGPVRDITLVGAYHDFNADDGPDGLGREFDISATASVGRFKFFTAIADYNADTFATDIRRIWASVAVDF